LESSAQRWLNPFLPHFHCEPWTMVLAIESWYSAVTCTSTHLFVEERLLFAVAIVSAIVFGVSDDARRHKLCRFGRFGRLRDVLF
jgi:hypothetical protein